MRFCPTLHDGHGEDGRDEEERRDVQKLHLEVTRRRCLKSGKRLIFRERLTLNRHAHTFTFRESLCLCCLNRLVLWSDSFRLTGTVSRPGRFRSPFAFAGRPSSSTGAPAPRARAASGTENKVHDFSKAPMTILF